MGLPPGLTVDGYEVQFGTNHMGHAMFLKYLLPLMDTTASTGRDVRLITTSSSAFQGASGIAYDTIKTSQSMFFGPFRRYMQSKLANTYTRRRSPRSIRISCRAPSSRVLSPLTLAATTRVS